MKTLRTPKSLYHASCLPQLSLSLRQVFCRTFFPSVILIWLALFAYAKSAGNKIQVKNQNVQKDYKASISASSSDQLRRIESIDHAIIVAGHSVMKLSKLSNADINEDSWHLLSYQIGQDLPRIITSHVKKGVDLVKANLNSILIFSGGQTRNDVG